MIIKKRAIVEEKVFKRVSWQESSGLICNKGCNSKCEEDENVCELCDIVGEITDTYFSYIHWGYVYERKR